MIESYLQQRLEVWPINHNLGIHSGATVNAEAQVAKLTYY